MRLLIFFDPSNIYMGFALNHDAFMGVLDYMVMDADLFENDHEYYGSCMSLAYAHIFIFP